ncbi:MAG: outer membrane protein assembly factor BamE [Novosphingobium sp.]|nr:outer membrane protein assembly factor BamE [Novosphingobium sp.]
MRNFRHSLWLAGVTLGLALAAGGCSSIRDHRGYMIDNALVDAVQPGVDNRTSVEQSLGRATFESQFGNKDWYYVSQNTKTPAFRRPRTEDQTVFRVRFDAGGNVVGVDRRGIEQVARLSPDGDKTKTLGRDRGFLEDLFGNVGSVGIPGGGPGGGGGPGPNGS